MESSQALVLTHYPYAESSLVVHAYTLEWGRQSFMVNGVRQRKARHPAAYFRPLAELQIMAYYHPRRDMHRIKEVQLLQPRHGVVAHYARTSIALFVAELLHKLLQSHESEPELYRFLSQFAQRLDTTTEPLGLLPIRFMAELSQPLGIQPTPASGAEAAYFDMRDGCFVPAPPLHADMLQGAQAQLFARSLSARPAQLDKAQRRQLLKLWVQYFRIHYDSLRQLHADDILAQVFGA